ncbi:MAG: ABC-type transport auxiliary lipoprotein family protein [Aquabacterium sp.]
MTFTHRLPHRCLALAMCSVGLFFTGCASTPEPQLLSLPLPADTPAAPNAQPANAQAMLMLRRVNIPEYLQTLRVRYRAADSVLAEWPNAVWAERLESGLTDHLLIRLRDRLPGWTVCERTCPPSKNAYALTLDLSPLDLVRPAGELRAQAHWQFTWRGDSNNAVHDGARALALRTTSDSAQGQAEAMAHMLDALAQDIAEQIMQQRSIDAAQSPRQTKPPTAVETAP